MYQEFYIPHGYYEQDFDGDCAKLSKSQVEHMRDHMDGLIKQLYSNSPLNVEFLETNIEEICHILNVEMPLNEPMISRCVI